MTPSIQQVERECNTEADALARLGVIFKNINSTNVLVIHIMKHVYERMEEMVEITTVDGDDDNNHENVASWIQKYNKLFDSWDTTCQQQ